jgi:AraC family transcriptional regulator
LSPLVSQPDLPTIDYTQESSLTHPRPAIVSSRGAGWDRLQLCHFPTPAHAVPEHYSSHHVIFVNFGNRLDMQQTVDGRQETVDFAQGAIGIIPANVLQKFEWHQETSFLDLYLEPSLLTQTSIELSINDSIELAPKMGFCDPLIFQMAAALKTSLEIDPSGSRLYANTMGGALAAHLISRYSTCKPAIKSCSGKLSAQQLKQVIVYINEHLDRNLSLIELANVAQLSSYHFARLFKQSTGLAPHQYHLQCRIDRAKQLMQTRDLGLAEIAYAVGFTSQGHLNYHFKRVVGVTPKAFLQQQ